MNFARLCLLRPASALLLLLLLLLLLVVEPALCFLPAPVPAPKGIIIRRAHHKKSTSLSVSSDQILGILQENWNNALQAVAEYPSSAVVELVQGNTADMSPSELATSLLPVAGVAAALKPVLSTTTIVLKSILEIIKPTKRPERLVGSYRTYPEGQPCTYELSNTVVPFEFGKAAMVRPLLKQTQLETRRLKVVYDANRDGYDPLVFHKKVDGKGAAVVLCKVRGKWHGGYNPRGWASLGSPRSSVAAFLFTQKNLFGGWQKLRVNMRGGMACGNDLYDGGIQFGADGLVMPLQEPNRRQVTSRLGQFYEAIPGSGKDSLFDRPGLKFKLQELYVLTGVYAEGEDIPNSGGVLELGQF